MGSGGMNFDQLRRQFSDLVAELHARRLAIPAGVILVAIVAAVFVLPKSPTPPPPTPVVNQNTGEVEEAPVQVSLRMVGVNNLEDDVPLTESENPFGGKGSYKCRVTKSSAPKEFECLVGDMLVNYRCPVAKADDPGTGACATKSGASGGTGASSSTGKTDSGGGSTGGTGGGDTNGKKKPSTKESYYVASLTLDGKSFSNVVAGDPLPNATAPLATYAGTNDSNTRGLFIAGDKVTVTGVTVDEDLGVFELAKGKTATLTDESGVVHKLTLKSLKKVTK